MAGANGISIHLDKEESIALRKILDKKSVVNIYTGCIEWTGSTVRGMHGQLRRNKKAMLAHRVSFALANGGVLDDLCVCHKCDNPKCINPEHLFAGTHQDNMADMVSKKRLAFGERVGTSKLSFAQVQAMRIWSQTGMLQRKIAEKFGVGQDTVSRNINGKRWQRCEALYGE